MFGRYLIKDKEKRKRVAHIVAGATILFHSYENYQTRHHPYELFAVAGTIVLLLALFHPMIEKKWPWIDGLFFVIEGILSFVMAFDLYHFGKKALPTTYVLLGIFQFFMAFRKGKKGIETHNRQRTTDN